MPSIVQGRIQFPRVDADTTQIPTRAVKSTKDLPGGAAGVFRRKIWSNGQKTPPELVPFKLDLEG